MSRRIVGFHEQNAYTKWRRMYCYLQKAGAVKGIKRRTHRRERREAQEEIRTFTVQDVRDWLDSDRNQW